MVGPVGSFVWLELCRVLWKFTNGFVSGLFNGDSTNGLWKFSEVYGGLQRVAKFLLFMVV